MRLLSGSILVFGQEIIVSGLAFLSNIFMARWLGPAQLGLLYVVNLIPAYADKLGRIGSFDDSAVYYINNKKYPPSDVAGHLFVVSFLLSLLPAILFLFFGDIFRATFVKEASIPDFYLWTAILTLPFTFLTLSSFKILLTQFEVRSYSIVQVLKPAVFLVLISIFWGLGWNLYGIVLSSFVASVLACAFALYFLRRETPLHFRLRSSMFGDLFSYGWKIYFTSTLIYLHQQADLAIVAYFLTFKEVGYYGLVAGLAQILWKIPNSVSVLYFPKISAEKTFDAVQLTASICRLTFAVLFVCALGVGLLAGPIIHLFYGEAYQPVIEPLLAILLGVVMMGPAKVLHQHFIGQGHPRAAFRAALVAASANIALDLFFVPRAGIVGAALVSSATYSLYLLWLVGEFRNRWRISFGDLLLLKKEDVILLVGKVRDRMGWLP